MAGQVNSYWNKTYTDAYQPWDAKLQVMVHELGHALGLDEYGAATCSGQPIMYSNSNRYFVCGHVEPQADDVSGINAIY